MKGWPLDLAGWLNLSVVPLSRHCEAVHTGQMLCCEVFDAQTEMSRRALVVDCLPGLHLLCQSENTRETASTQRR